MLARRATLAVRAGAAAAGLAAAVAAWPGGQARRETRGRPAHPDRHQLRARPAVGRHHRRLRGDPQQRCRRPAGVRPHQRGRPGRVPRPGRARRPRHAHDQLDRHPGALHRRDGPRRLPHADHRRRPDPRRQGHHPDPGLRARRPGLGGGCRSPTRSPAEAPTSSTDDQGASAARYAHGVVPMPALPPAGGTVLTDRFFAVPLDHQRPDGEQIEVFAREVVAAGQGRRRPALAAVPAGRPRVRRAAARGPGFLAGPGAGGLPGAAARPARHRPVLPGEPARPWPGSRPRARRRRPTT